MTRAALGPLRGLDRFAPVIPVLLALLLAACGGGGGGSLDPVVGPTAPATSVSSFDFGSNDTLKVTAFGDSITRGVLGDRESDRSVLSTSRSYPTVLQGMLRGLDPRWRVVERGEPGELTTDGLRRFPGAIIRDRSGFALIMEGTNDASAGEGATAIVANLQAMVDSALANKTLPILGTIPPNFRNDPRAQDTIGKVNASLRSMAQSRGIVLAEIFTGMNDRSLFASPELGIPDPLHPNERGYAVMAGIWFDALQRAGVTSTMMARRRTTSR